MFHFCLSNLTQTSLVANTSLEADRKGNSRKCSSSLAKLTQSKATTELLFVYLFIYMMLLCVWLYVAYKMQCPGEAL